MQICQSSKPKQMKKKKKWSQNTGDASKFEIPRVQKCNLEPSPT